MHCLRYLAAGAATSAADKPRQHAAHAATVQTGHSAGRRASLVFVCANSASHACCARVQRQQQQQQRNGLLIPASCCVSPIERGRDGCCLLGRHAKPKRVVADGVVVARSSARVRLRAKRGRRGGRKDKSGPIVAHARTRGRSSRVCRCCCCCRARAHTHRLAAQMQLPSARARCLRWQPAVVDIENVSRLNKQARAGLIRRSLASPRPLPVPLHTLLCALRCARSFIHSSFVSDVVMSAHTWRVARTIASVGQTWSSGDARATPSGAAQATIGARNRRVVAHFDATRRRRRRRGRRAERQSSLTMARVRGLPQQQQQPEHATFCVLESFERVPATQVHWQKKNGERRKNTRERARARVDV